MHKEININSLDKDFNSILFFKKINKKNLFYYIINY